MNVIILDYTGSKHEAGMATQSDMGWFDQPGWLEWPGWIIGLKGKGGSYSKGGSGVAKKLCYPYLLFIQTPKALVESFMTELGR